MVFFPCRDEWQGIGKKDPLTYWDAEEYPKTRGFGTTTNPIPIDSVEREQLPMRDSTWFSTPAKIRQVHQPARFIPHSGLTTETRMFLLSLSNIYIHISFFFKVNNLLLRVMLMPKIRNIVLSILPMFNLCQVQHQLMLLQQCIELTQ
jgi:hypothetical protein